MCFLVSIICSFNQVIWRKYHAAELIMSWIFLSLLDLEMEKRKQRTLNAEKNEFKASCTQRLVVILTEPIIWKEILNGPALFFCLSSSADVWNIRRTSCHLNGKFCERERVKKRREREKKGK